MSESPANSDESIDFGESIGSSTGISVQQLTLYIPNKDQNNREIGNQRMWVLEAAELLSEIGGGFTILPPVEGGWVNELGEIIWEQPVLVYTFIKPGPFLNAVPQLKEFLHRLGRETNQGEVVVDFDGRLHKIRLTLQETKPWQNAYVTPQMLIQESRIRARH